MSFELLLSLVHPYDYRHPSDTSFLSLAMFGVVEANKYRLKIQEYSVAQTSLEQIFNQFAALQDEERGSAAGITPIVQDSSTPQSL